MSTGLSSPWNLATILVENPRSLYPLRGSNASLFSRTPSHKPLKSSLANTLATQRLELRTNSLVAIVIYSDVWGMIIVVVRPLPTDQGAFVAGICQVGRRAEKSLEAAEANYLFLVACIPIHSQSIGRPIDMSQSTGRMRGALTVGTIRRKSIRTCAGATRVAIEPTRNLEVDARAKHTPSDLIRFVFNFSEIKATAVPIRDFICACLTCADNHIGELERMVEQKLDVFERLIDSALKPVESRATATIQLRRPSIAKANTGLSQSAISTLPNNITPCIESIGETTANILCFLLRTLRETNPLSLDSVVSGGKRLAGSALGTLCRRSKAIVHSRFTKAMTGLLASLRVALFTPIANWKIVGPLVKNKGRNIDLLDIIACILAFLINLASVLVEGGRPGHITAFDYRTSVDSNLGDPASVAALTDIKDCMGISISTIKALQIPTDIFAEAEIPVFGWGEFIPRVITLTLQFPRNRAAPGYNKRILLFACWASEAVLYHALLFLKLGHVLVSSRTLAATQMVTSVFSFAILVSMFWRDLGAQPENGAKAKQILYLNLYGSILGTVAGLAGKLSIIIPDPSTRTLRDTRCRRQ
ncbi:hypothetical protein FRC08_005181 [Ceratobasidium sp. 394]|nr:hypothetical protein FRC08_005181 [Ceratobasidium sp. 394]